jgi:hypothetical protein
LAFKHQGIRLDALSILLQMPDYTGESCALKPLGPFAYVPNPERGSEPIKQFPDEICDWIADVTIALRQESVRTRSVFNPPAMMKNVCNDERREPEMRLFLDMLTAYRGALLEHTNLEPMAYFKGFYAELASQYWPMVLALSIAFKLIKTTGDFPAMRKRLIDPPDKKAKPHRFKIRCWH